MRRKRKHLLIKISRFLHFERLVNTEEQGKEGEDEIIFDVPEAQLLDYIVATTGIDVDVVREVMQAQMSYIKTLRGEQ